MLAVLLGWAGNDSVRERVLSEQAIFGASITCTIKQTIKADGSVIWEEKSQEDAQTFWLHEFRYAANGDFVSQKHETVSTGRTDLFTVTAEGNSIIARMVKYNNESSDSSVKFKGKASEVADASRLWWAGIKPEIGTQISSFIYLQAFGFCPLKVTYTGDASLTIGGKVYDTHKVTREIEGMRNETWWIDDQGLPVKRIFWTDDESSPHRVDTIKN